MGSTKNKTQVLINLDYPLICTVIFGNNGGFVIHCTSHCGGSLGEIKNDFVLLGRAGSVTLQASC